MKNFTGQITIEEMVAEAKREIALRERVYPNLIRQRKLTEPDARLQMLKMQAILELLLRVQKIESPQRSFFGEEFAEENTDANV